MPESFGAQVSCGFDSILCMGLMVDPWGVYLHLANTFLHLVELGGHRAPSCSCHCEEVSRVVVSGCSTLVKDILNTCWDQTPSTITTTTTRPSEQSWGFSWFWILVVVFALGLSAGAFLAGLGSKRKNQPYVPPAIENSVPVKGRKGVAA